MENFKNWLLRVIPVFVLVVVLVVTFAVPASAAPADIAFDWVDYMNRPMPDFDDPSLVSFYVNLPVKNAYWDNRYLSGFMDGFYNTNTITVSDSAEVRCFPFGFPGSEHSIMRLDGIPSGTKINTIFSFEIAPEYAGVEFSYVLQARYYDEDGNVIGVAENTQYVIVDSMASTSFNIPFSTMYDVSSGWKYIDYVLFIRQDGGGVPFTVTMNETYFLLTVTDAYINALSFDRQLEILSAILEAEKNSDVEVNVDITEDIHSALNDVFAPILGAPIYPDASGSVGDVMDQESDIMDNTASGRDQFASSFAEALLYIQQYAGAFAAVSYIFNCFYHHPFLLVLTTVSLAIGIFSTLLGSIAIFGHSEGFSRKVADAGKKDGRRR